MQVGRLLRGTESFYCAVWFDGALLGGFQSLMNSLNANASGSNLLSSLEKLGK